MLRPGFPRLSHPEVAHAIPSVGFMAQVYRRVRLLVSPTIVGVQLTDQQRTAQAPSFQRRPDDEFETDRSEHRLPGPTLGRGVGVTVWL